jgi:branched-chain amino acid transport system ATP-binding protein
MSVPFLELAEIEAGYGKARVLHGITLEIALGEVVTLIGRNGMGKTTIVKAIMGQLPLAAGTIRCAGKDISGWPDYRIARCGVGLVPEGRGIFPNLSVMENLVSGAANRHAAVDPWTLDRVYRMFPRLRERERNLGRNLSGGEQQMLAIGRALMTNPLLLILDEATEGLAPLVRQEIWNCLDELKRTGLALLVIDKNIGPLSRLADRHFVIEKGRVVWRGCSNELRSQREIVHRYAAV